MLGSLGLLYLGACWIVSLFHPDWGLTPLAGRPALICSVGLFLLGGQLICTGLLAELSVASHHHESEACLIAERTDPPDAAAEDKAITGMPDGRSMAS